MRYCENPACPICANPRPLFKPRERAKESSVHLRRQRRGKYVPAHGPAVAVSRAGGAPPMSRKEAVAIVKEALFRPLFPTGPVYQKRKALTAASNELKSELVARHTQGDFGIVVPEVAEDNFLNIRERSGGVVSLYQLPNKRVLVLATDFDNKETIMLDLDEAPPAFREVVDRSKLRK